MRNVLATLSDSYGGRRGITCREEECPYKKECANHVTAGDFRSEDGFSPDLRLVMPEGMIGVVPGGPKITPDVHCNSIDQNPLYEQFRTVPVNYDDLDNGCVYLDENTGRLMSYGFERDCDDLDWSRLSVDRDLDWLDDDPYNRPGYY